MSIRGMWCAVLVAAIAVCVGCDKREGDPVAPHKVAVLQKEAREAEQQRHTEACAPGNSYEHVRVYEAGEMGDNSIDVVVDRHSAAQSAPECFVVDGVMESCLGDVFGRALIRVASVPVGIDAESLPGPLCPVGVVYLQEYSRLYRMLDLQQARRLEREIRRSEDLRIRELLLDHQQ